MNASTVARIEQLYPPLKVKAYQLIQLLSLKGVDVEVSQGLRSWAEQAALYAEGRTAPGKIVTHAPPGYSWHEFALAFDFDIQTVNGLDWDGSDEAWQATIAAGEGLGLVSGSEWHGDREDEPHFQFPSRFGVSPTDEVRALYASGGLPAVWAAIDPIQQGDEDVASD